MGAQHLLRAPVFQPQAPAPASFFIDAFTGTDGDLLTGRTGWEAHTSEAGWDSAMKIKTNRAYGDGNSVVRHTVALPSDNYTITVPYRCVSADNVAGIVTCISGDIFYRFVYVAPFGIWQIQKWNATSTSDLANSSTWTPTPGVSYTIEVTMTGAGMTLKSDGATLATSSDTSLGRQAKAGLITAFGPSVSTGLHADSFTIEED